MEVGQGHNEGEGKGGSVGGQGCRSTVVSSGGGCAGRGSTEDATSLELLREVQSRTQGEGSRSI